MVETQPRPLKLHALITPPAGWCARSANRADFVRFALSLNDRAEVRETFARFRLESVRTTYTIVGHGRTKRARELLITAGRTFRRRV